MKQQLKIYVLIILMISFLGCFGKSSPQNSDTPPSSSQTSKSSPSLVLRGEDKASPTIVLNPARSLVFTQSAHDWKSDFSSLPFFEVVVKDPDTAAENLELEYYIYLEGNPLPDSYFKKTIKVTHDRWKIEVTEKNLPPDSIEFVGTRKFILRLKATDPVHPAVFKEVSFSISNTQPEVTAEADPSDLNLSLLVSSSDFEGALFQRKTFSQVYSTILLRSTSLEPMVIQIDFDGYLKKEIKYSRQQWNEEVFETTIGRAIQSSEAPVVLEVKELKENGELVDAQVKKLSDEKNGYLLRHGLVLVFKTDGFVEGLPSGAGVANFDVRIDEVKLQKRRFHILSTPDGMGGSFYENAQNWTDITPQDPFPILKIVSK